MANLSVVENHLWVVESNGNPRSGKGTITSALADAFPGAAMDETGADYRAVTFGLITDGKIEPGMSETRIGNVVKKLGSTSMAAYAAQRHEIVAEQGPEALYNPTVEALVQFVSGNDEAREAVKEGFARRVERQVGNPDTHFLFVDGRNLTPIIRGVEGADLLLRLFIDCQLFAATQREAMRSGIDLNDPANDTWFRERLMGLQKRKSVDENRPNDAVKREPTAISYWHNGAVSVETAEQQAAELVIPFSRAAGMLTSGQGSFRKGGRRGAGALAAALDKQVYFDTTEINRGAMVAHAKTMVEEALAYRAGRYAPISANFFEEAA